MEIWKPAKGFEQFYEVSNFGRVRSVDRTIVYIDGRTFHYKGKLIKGKKDKRGYIVFSLNLNGTKLSKRGHRLVAETFIENPDVKPTVNHIDGNKENNKVSNLEWATYSENTSKGYEIGLFEASRNKSRNRWKNNKLQAKPVEVLFKKNGDVIAFDSAREASDHIGKCKNYFTQLLRIGGENKFYKVKQLNSTESV